MNSKIESVSDRCFLFVLIFYTFYYRKIFDIEGGINYDDSFISCSECCISNGVCYGSIVRRCSLLGTYGILVITSISCSIKSI